MKNFEWFEEWNSSDLFDEDESNNDEVDSSNEDSNESDDDGGSNLPEASNNKNKKSVGQKASDIAQKAKQAKDIGTKVGKLSKILGPLMPVLGYIAIIVAVLIAAIGLLMFLLTMPGAILEKIKQLAQDFGNALINAVIGEANNVKQSQISDVATRLEDMGYDMYAYGFESDKIKPEAGSNFWGSTVYHTEFLNNEVPTHDFFDAGYKPDMDTLRVTNDGILRDKNGIVYIESDYIKAYLVSDNYVYMIKNNNFNLKNVFNSIVHLNFFRSLFGKGFGEGLMALYHEGSGIGTRGDPFDIFEKVGGFIRALFGGDRINIYVDRDAKQLVVATDVDGIWGVTRKFVYNMDGWTGRYGMPLEFLLSLHLSSMQPDLAYDLVTQTKTEIQLVAHESKAEVFGGIKLEDGTICTTDDLDERRDFLVQQQEDLMEADLRSRGWNGFTMFTSSIFGGEDYEAVCQPYWDKIDEIKEKFKAYKEITKKLDSKEFRTYIPYIYKVDNHWFRDVYFSDNAGVSEFIEVDDEYEQRTAERWTRYETVPVGETGVDTGDLDNTITYDDGNGNKYAAERSEYTRGGLGDVQYVLYYYKGGKLDNETVYKYNGKYGTKEDAEQDTSLTADEKKSLHKKAITSTLDYVYYKDADKDYDGKVSGVSGRWVAYKEEASPGSWQKYEAEEGNAESLDAEEAKDLYYKVDLSSSVSQVEDGQRGPTNKKAKEIFSINKYYTYNGTAERAADIDNDRYGSNVKSEYEKFKKGENTSFNTDSDPRNKDLIDTFSVTRDSISAFNILTNMNTMDSDAIYHDFKELIVELNFFDKEELTVVANESFEWPIPEIGSRNWPLRKYSKYENEYGTSLHSKYLLDFLKGVNNIELSKATAAENIEDNSQRAVMAPAANSSNSMDTINNTSSLQTILPTEYVGQVQGKATEFTAPFDEFTATNTTVERSVGIALGEKTVADYTLDDWLDSTEEMCKEMDAVGYDYCVCVGDAGDGKQKCHHAPANGGVHDNEAHGKCTLPTTYEESKTSQTYNVCCATLVSWALERMGLIKGAQHGANSLYAWIEQNLDCERIEKSQPLEEGDILCYEGHIDINGRSTGGGFTKFNGGHAVAGEELGIPLKVVGSNPSSSYLGTGGWSERATHALRLNWGGKKNEDAYKGYKGGELVVSPVTGVVIQAGTKQKITNIETGLKEYVGFVKIRALDRIDFTAAFGKDGSQEEDLEGFKYFLEEYEDNKVAGDTFYIEGFSLELLDDSLKVTSNDNVVNEKGEPINEYTQQNYKTVLNKKAKKELERKESARVKAKSVYESSAGLIIKEGTALGTTYSDGDYETKSQEYLNELLKKEGLEENVIKPKEEIKSDDPRKERTITERPGLTGADGSENLYDHEEILKEKGDGNYIRLVMRASKDGTDAKVEKDSIIENVENYLEIERPKNTDIDWELWYWLPFESGAADTVPYGKNRFTGPVSVSSCSSGEVAIGIIQWTSLLSGCCNQRDQFYPVMKEEFPEFAQTLSFMEGKGPQWYWDDFNGANQMQAGLKACDDRDHEGFLKAQIKVATINEYDPMIEKHPWIAERPKCVQAEILHLRIWAPSLISNVDAHKDESNEEILKWVRHMIANTKSTANQNPSGDESKGRAWNEPEIGFAILDGRMNIEQIEQWVRKEDLGVLAECGVDYR